ncbi:MAG: hypothetical protein ABI891_02475 [Acidobacteriota bacterium]
MNDVMYRRPKFLEVLLEIRQEMSREADYDVDLFAEMIRSGKFSSDGNRHNLTDSKTDTEKTKSKSEI